MSEVWIFVYGAFLTGLLLLWLVRIGQIKDRPSELDDKIEAERASRAEMYRQSSVPRSGLGRDPGRRDVPPPASPYHH